jgi:RNA-directed DNA polymerase
MAVRVWDIGRSERCLVTRQIRVSTLRGTKVSPRPIGLSLQENMENRLNEEKQMTTQALPVIGASSAYASSWDTTDWNAQEKKVRRLQMRIAKALREGRYGKVKALQWLLTHSWAAKLLAVRRVAQNAGSKTPGVDGVLWRTPNKKMKAVLSLKRRGYKPHPLRRIYIPKRNGKRPLSIPCMIDRAMQALHLLALDPVSETLADKNSYGFRPKRSTADAIGQCYIVFTREKAAPWILEGDIRACFDNLSGPWLQENILMDRKLLTLWLTAGYMEKGLLHPTFNGVPQGGVASPTLLVLALRGFEQAIKSGTARKDKVNVVVYADDFIITGASREVLEHKVRPLVEAFLKERGLELSPEKTKITHIDEGFDFLGFNVRKYKGKLLIKPSKKSIKSFLAEVRRIIKCHRTATTESLVSSLNLVIRGWTNYFRHVVSKATFAHVDHFIYRALWQWAKRRHPEKGALWTRKKYFRSQGTRNWIFFAKVPSKKTDRFLDLLSASSVPIRRHIKIRAEATPYDPRFKTYFQQRERLKKKPLNTRDQKEQTLTI